MFTPSIRIVLCASALALLVGCQRSTDAPADNSTPAGAVRTAAAALHKGDLAGWLAVEVPPAQLAKARREWQQEVQQQPLSDSERADFERTMADLTGPDAEQRLMEQLEPKLADFEKNGVAHMPMMISAGKGMAVSSIQENKALTETQKEQAIASVDAVGDWLQSTKFTDREQARKAIAVLVAAARELNLAKADDLRALSFDDAVSRGSVVLGATKRVGVLYGLDLDGMLASVRTELVSEQAGSAVVRVSFQAFGQDLSFDREMVEVDGRWYAKRTIDYLSDLPLDTGDQAPASAGR
jgi:hypothetical protein